MALRSSRAMFWWARAASGFSRSRILGLRSMLAAAGFSIFSSAGAPARTSARWPYEWPLPRYERRDSRFTGVAIKLGGAIERAGDYNPVKRIARIRGKGQPFPDLR